MRIVPFERRPSALRCSLQLNLFSAIFTWFAIRNVHSGNTSFLISLDRGTVGSIHSHWICWSIQIFLFQLSDDSRVFNRDPPLIRSSVKKSELRRYRVFHLSNKRMTGISGLAIPITAIELKHEMLFGFCFSHVVFPPFAGFLFGNIDSFPNRERVSRLSVLSIIHNFI